MKLKTRRRLRKKRIRNKFKKGILRLGMNITKADSYFYLKGTRIGKSVKKVKGIIRMEITAKA